MPLERDVILMAVPDEEIGGALGALWMKEHHYKEFEPEYILDEGGFGSRDLFAPGNWSSACRLPKRRSSG